jgi:choline-sulfatase
VGVFNDGWQFRRKSRRFFSEEGSDEYLDSRRREYDEYIAYADAELGRLYRSIARRGLLDDTYLVVTTDHGEMFERGIGGHLTPTMYDPLVRVPLVICAPGQEQREDVHTPTSSIDVLPTLLHVTGQPIPEWCEGQVMPPFTDQPTRDGRSTYVVDAKSNARQGPLTRATVALIKGPYKLVHYFGYRQHPDDYELYNVANDPEEMEDLYPSQVALARELREELSVRIQKANEPYLTGRR